MPRHIRHRLFLGIAAGLAILAAGVWSLVLAREERSSLLFVAFDVGQGDAIFIETPERYQILIDGGPDETVAGKLARVMPFWDRTIDLVILTHAHADHVAGLIPVLTRYRVGQVIESGQVHETAEYREWRRLVQDLGIQSHAALRGMTAYVGSSTAVKILEPSRSAAGARFRNPHEGNVVAEVSFGRTKFLLMGDAELDEELDLVRRGVGPVDLLKVGHHGSKTSTSELLLAAVLPEYAVISAGRGNRYGHPHPDVVDRLGRFQVKVFRTDINGDLEFVSDGERVVAASRAL